MEILGSDTFPVAIHEQWIICNRKQIIIAMLFSSRTALFVKEHVLLTEKTYSIILFIKKSFKWLMQTNVSSNVICKLLLCLLVVHTIRKALQKCCNKLQKKYSLHIRDQPTMKKLSAHCSIWKSFLKWVLLFENALILNFVTAIYEDHQKMLSNVGKCPFDTALSSLVLTLPLLKELTLGVKLASSQKKMEIGDATQNYDPPVSPSHSLTRLVLLIVLRDAKL